MLGYAAAAKRISVFLGPLFVGSKIDDISTIKGTWILTHVTSTRCIKDTCINWGKTQRLTLICLRVTYCRLCIQLLSKSVIFPSIYNFTLLFSLHLFFNSHYQWLKVQRAQKGSQWGLPSILIPPLPVSLP